MNLKPRFLLKVLRMNYKILIVSLPITLSISTFAQERRQYPQLGKDKIEDVITALTIKEKVSLLMGLGKQNWEKPEADGKSIFVSGIGGRTFAIPRLGIPSVIFADGPAGLHISAVQDIEGVAKAEMEMSPEEQKKQEKISQKSKESKYSYCTAFPTEIAIASSWNVDLLEKVGQAMGKESLEYGIDAILAPAMNIQRNPLCGRNFEYYSEDPLLSGKLAAALVRGIQTNGVGACVKHFAANNQETNRHSFDPLEVGTGWHRVLDKPTINAVISERALREIYLRGFEIAIKESNPKLLMSSYNRLNGFYTSESKDLLTTILRNEWDFKGFVCSDWRAGADVTAQIRAGNDILMPGRYQYDEIMNALKNKTLDEKDINVNVERILNFVLATPRFKSYSNSNAPDLMEHAKVAYQSALESIVLLKNINNTLPLKNTKNVALFGKTSYHFITGGTGSGEVNYKHAVSLLDAFQNNGYKISKSMIRTYQQFIDSVTNNSAQVKKKQAVDFHDEMDISLKQIKEQEKNSDIGIITIGRSSGEGFDRKEKDDFCLSKNEIALINNVSSVYHKANKKVVVVLNIGGVIETDSWRDAADAIVLAWQTGQEGGNAVFDILNGKQSPSGKLAVSFPIKYSDVPSSSPAMFPGLPVDNPVNALYNEGIYVGYRYYSSFNIPVAYEFGYGMSYTKFEYSDLKLSNNVFDNKIQVEVTIKNTGKVSGKEVVQLYITAPTSQIDKPVYELKCFAKTNFLNPNDSQKLSFEITPKQLASFWSGKSEWIADKGNYEVLIGASSKDIRLKSSFVIKDDIMVEKVNDVLYPNYKLTEINR